MPYRLQKDTFTRDTAGLMSADYPYTYPRNLKLKPGSRLHDKLRDMIMERAMASRDAMSVRYPSWNEIDRKLTAYIDLSAEETDLQQTDVTKPVSIVVPVSYAALETLLGYMVAMFLDEPIFRYEGVGGEDIKGAMLMERLIEHQTRRSVLGLNLHTLFRDGFAYGLGGIVPVWEKQLGFRTVRDGNNKRRQRVIKYEGNTYYNIDPYKYFPDPNYGIQDVQKSEFQGWILQSDRMELMSMEEADPENYFNVRYLEHIDGRSSLGQDESDRAHDNVDPDSNITGNRIDVLWMSINLIPNEWKLGRRKYPEKWLLGLAGDEIIISAAPAAHDHGMHTIAIFAPDYDGRAITPISKMETIYGEQTITDFLYNSHVANVRKAIHDMFVYDPLAINTNDLTSPGPGKLIRTRKRAWGTGVKDYIQQFAVSDITRQHLVDAGVVIERMENSLGVGDLVKGVVRGGGERRSATEYRETKNSAMLKLEKIARIGALQTIRNLAYMTASHTQQYLSSSQFVKIAGEYNEELTKLFPDAVDGRVEVGPLDILVDYDVIMPDGSLPNSGDPGTWGNIFQQVSANPYLLQTFDIVKIFTHWAKISGAKNLEDFILRGDKKIKVVQDETLARQVEAGNAIPLKGAKSATG